MKVLIAAAIFGISFGNYGCSNESKFAGRTMPASEAPAAPASSPGAAIQTTADANPSGVTTTGATITTTTGTTSPSTAVVTGNTGGATTTGTTTGTSTVVTPTWVDVTNVGPNRTFQDPRTGLRWSNRRPDANWQGATNHCSTLTYNGVMGWRLPSKEDLVAARDNGINGAVWEPQNISRGGWLNISDLGAEFYWGSASASDTLNAWVVYLGNFNEPTLRGKSLTNAVVCVQ